MYKGNVGVSSEHIHIQHVPSTYTKIKYFTPCRINFEILQTYYFGTLMEFQLCYTHNYILYIYTYNCAVWVPHYFWTLGCVDLREC